MKEPKGLLGTQISVLSIDFLKIFYIGLPKKTFTLHSGGGA
jgi:hypothetical protein